MSEIREANLFEEAKFRYEHCSSNRWKNVWWDVCCDIFKRATSWAQKYVLNPITKAILRRDEKIEEHHFAYFEALFNSQNELVFNKVGTSDNPVRRWGENLRAAYARRFDLTFDKIYRCWDTGSVPAEGLESHLRSMLIAKYQGRNYYPNDRFRFDDNDFPPPTPEEIDTWANNYFEICKSFAASMR